MKAVLAALAMMALFVAGSASAEKLTIALSSSEIEINSSFTGTKMTIFGVIEGEAAVAPTSDYGVAVVVLGPRESVVARRRDRMLGIWANRGAQTMLVPPTFYSLHLSSPAAELAKPAVRSRLQLGFDKISFIYPGKKANDPAVAEYRDAFIRLKEDAGLFSEDVDVDFVGKLVFRVTAQLPANIPVGAYLTVAYVFSGGELVAQAGDRFEVLKTGAEEAISRFSRTQSLAYGVICVLLAVFIGWLGGVVFRRD